VASSDPLESSGERIDGGVYRYCDYDCRTENETLVTRPRESV
jgi:hypothetical protein